MLRPPFPPVRGDSAREYTGVSLSLFRLLGEVFPILEWVPWNASIIVDTHRPSSPVVASNWSGEMLPRLECIRFSL